MQGEAMKGSEHSELEVEDRSTLSDAASFTLPLNQLS